MAQGKLGHRVDVFFGDGRRATPRRMRPGTAQPDQVGAQTIDTGGKTALGDLRQGLVIQFDTVEARARLASAFAQSRLLLGPLCAESHRVAVEIQAAADDLPALSRQGLPT